MFDNKPSDAGDEHTVPLQLQPTEGRIVGIGASAAELEALEQLFDALPPETGMAFVVVQPRSPDVRGLRGLIERIARHSEMPVVIAEDHMPVCANHIYLVPPRKQMIIRDRHLVLTGKEPQAFTLPIDTFFRSLAQDVGAQGVAIVLSGGGSDGSRGVVEVERAGGLVLAEAAASTKFGRMPLPDAATGVVDHVDPPRDLARVLGGLRPAASNEELRSANQELYTINAKYQHTIMKCKELDTDLAHLLEGSDVGTVFLDRELRIRRFTSRIANVFRFQPYDIGRRISDFSHNLERSQLIEEIEQVRATGMVIEAEVRDRNSVPYLLRIQPYRISPTGDAEVDAAPIEGVVVTLTDISALIAARRQLEQHQLRIATLLGQAEESARRREQFIAMLSHELRNPLAAVMSATALIMERPDGASVARCQAVIERHARHMKRLLDDLLDVSRITRGTLQLRHDDIDLRGPIESAIESAGPALADRDITLACSLPHEAMPVRGDAARLVQVVVNLLSNAATYSPSKSCVRLLVTIEDGHGVIRVIDQGVGIEPELQGKIFDLFVQSEQRLDRSRGGLGVGLSLAKNIVDLHGGTIEVHSAGPGQGSEFRVAIPLIQPRVRSWSSKPMPVRPTDRCRIVLVDDQADSREMLRMLLESRDHIVIDVEDGPTAIDVITREKPDVAFIDIGLPAMNGYEVAQRIRNRPGLEDVLLVALTGYGAPSDISTARAAGFDEHVIKPAELAKLEQILATKKLRMTD